MFPLKTMKYFPSSLRRRNLKMWQSPVIHFDFVFEENSGTEKSRDYRNLIVLKLFRPQLKTKPAFWNFPGSVEKLWKWRIIIAVNFQFKQLERRSLEKMRASKGFEPVTARYLCDALSTELWSHTLRARSIYWVHISREEWNDVKYIFELRV